jgi:hypothetical protein
MKNRVLQYDFETLPEVPFPIYFIKDGEVCPKRIFTVIAKAVNSEKGQVDLFIQELDRNVAYHPDKIVKVKQMHVN